MRMTSSISGATVGRTLFTLVGASVAGPVGGIVGNLAGGLLHAILPGPTDIVSNVLGNVTTEALRKTGNALADRLGPQEKQRINHDLQTAFRDAFQEALYDVGGAACFPQAWHQRRDVPPDTVFALTPQGNRLWRDKSPLAGQVQACFQDMQRALLEKRLLPIDPPRDQPAASVTQFLAADTPQALVDAFYVQALAPFLASYKTLLAELPDFERHLRSHLLNRTLVHLGEALKERPRAWRAFNRLMLEGMRDELQALGAGQAEITKRLDDLLTRPDAEGVAGWADGMADLLTATGQIQKQLDEGFDSITRRVVEQHQEIVTRLDGLLVVTVRIETKVDRVLHILEDGRYEIVGKAAVPVDVPPEPGDPPYKGLQHFDQGDADLFFGRELLTARLAGHLRQHNFLAVVVGASGSGKSSVVRAGLLPALRRGEPLADGTLPPAGSTAWPVTVLTPTARPLDALASHLTTSVESVSAAATLAADLAVNARSLGLYIRRLLATSRPPAGRLLLVVDQFEELFTLCQDPVERKAFVDNLLTAAGYDRLSLPDTAGNSEADPEHTPSAVPKAGIDSPVVVVITLRADFYHHCAQYANLRQALEQSQAFIGPMGVDELRRAIEEPARLGGWEFERGLVNLILRDVGDEPGALPLLSHALLETWKHRRGRVMTLESYAESGGVRGAIAKTADAVYLGLMLEQQVIARSIFLRLTELGEGTQDTRRRVELAELIPSSQEAPAVRSVIMVLADERLITTDKDLRSGEETVEVSHEALIREWPRLRSWLDEDRAGLRVHRALTEAAQEWQKLDQEPGSLYRGARLVDAGEYAEAHQDTLNPLEREFLAASLDAVAAEAAEREARRQQELEHQRALAEAHQKEAETERHRAEEQTRSAARLRARNRVISAIGALAVTAALIAVLLGLQSGQNARQASRNAATAEAASTYALAQESTAVAASTRALAEQAKAEANANARATAEAVANEQRDEAQAQARLALSRQLAYEAASLLSSRADLALLLDIEARRIVDTTEARSSLIGMLQESPRLGEFLHGGNNNTWGLAFSPDGAILATASHDNLVTLWDVATKQRIGEPMAGHTVSPMCLAFSPDGRLMASSGSDGLIILWDVARQQPSGQPIQVGEWVGSLAFSPDGKLLASSNGYGGPILLWDVATRQQVGQLEGGSLTSTGGERTLAFTPDGKQLVSASYPPTVWDISSRQPITSIPGGAAHVALSPDGTMLATLQDDAIVLWNISTVGAEGGAAQAIGVPLRRHEGKVVSAAFSPDGRVLASGGEDGTVILWNVATGEPLGDPLVGFGNRVRNLTFSPNGDLLASSGDAGYVVLWNLAERVPLIWAQLGAHPGIDELVFNSNGNVLASYSFDTPESPFTVIWNVSDWGEKGLNAEAPISRTVEGTAQVVGPEGDLVIVPPDDSDVLVLDGWPGQVRANQIAFRSNTVYNPDGRRFVTRDQPAGHFTLWKLSSDRAEPLAPPSWTNEDPAQAIGDPIEGRFVGFSSDGTRLASVETDQGIVLRDAATGELVGQPLGADLGENGFVMLSPGGKTLIWENQGDPGTVTLWDMDASQVIGQPITGTLPSTRIHSLFSPDGKVVVVEVPDDSGETVIRLVDSTSGQPLGAPLNGQFETFGANGKTVLTQFYQGSNSTVIVWDASTGSPIGAQLKGYLEDLSADGSLMVLSQDGVVTLADAATGQALGHPFTALLGCLNIRVALSPDSRTLAVACGDEEDGRIILWNVDVDAWEERACQIANRNLTRAEWAHYFPNRPYQRTCDSFPLEGEEAASPEPQASTADLVAGELLYTADFSDPSSGWDIESDSDVERAYAEGRYHIRVNTENMMGWGNSDMFFGDFVAEVEARKEEGSAATGYGFVLRAINNHEFYWFEINSQGAYKFRKSVIKGISDRDWVDLIDWTHSDAIKSGQATNVLKVMAKGDTFVFFANGQQLAAYEEGDFSYGVLGLAGAKYDDDDTAHVSFDNLKVWALE